MSTANQGEEPAPWQQVCSGSLIPDLQMGKLRQKGLMLVSGRGWGGQGELCSKTAEVSFQMPSALLCALGNAWRALWK